MAHARSNRVPSHLGSFPVTCGVAPCRVGRSRGAAVSAVARKRRNLDGRKPCSVRPQEGQRAVEPTNHAESSFVNSAMVAPAQEHKVVEARGAAVGPAGAPGARGLRAGVE